MKQYLSLVCFLLALHVSFAQLPTKPVLTVEVAKHIAAVAAKEATANNISMVIAILDDGGHLLYFERMNNVQLGSIDVALEKARTALYFKRPTKTYQERVTNGEHFLLKVPTIIPVEGGLPLVCNGYVVGSIGISGGTPQQDGAVAQAAVNAFNSYCGQK